MRKAIVEVVLDIDNVGTDPRLRDEDLLKNFAGEIVLKTLKGVQLPPTIKDVRVRNVDLD